ncbi:hypothetical protein Nepgr_018718 [Nepenthes gracilis]|uniref:Uncharacterized protein n=1 Tax=Nepenthes gracilis TaxID=150966 RepID=A0AAD3SUP3_NEPGR|nr:hypothetical protein Nepgr_018718 [Nepenthes gracilis]
MVFDAIALAEWIIHVLRKCGSFCNSNDMVNSNALWVQLVMLRSIVIELHNFTTVYCLLQVTGVFQFAGRLSAYGAAAMMMLKNCHTQGSYDLGCCLGRVYWADLPCPRHCYRPDFRNGTVWVELPLALVVPCIAGEVPRLASVDQLNDLGDLVVADFGLSTRAQNRPKPIYLMAPEQSGSSEANAVVNMLQSACPQALAYESGSHVGLEDRPSDRKMDAEALKVSSSAHVVPCSSGMGLVLCSPTTDSDSEPAEDEAGLKCIQVDDGGTSHCLVDDGGASYCTLVDPDGAHQDLDNLSCDLD